MFRIPGIQSNSCRCLRSERVSNEVKLDQRHALHPTNRIGHTRVEEEVGNVPLEQICRTVLEVEALSTGLAWARVSLYNAMMIPKE